MIVPALVLSFLAAGDALVLREQARVEGRWIRLADLLDADRSGTGSRGLADGVWMGRAPEEGGRRVVSAAEIRRELERRGIDASAIEIVGPGVEVLREAAPDADPARARLAAEIRRHLLSKDPSCAPSDLSVRITSAWPESWDAGPGAAAVTERDGGFVVAFPGPDGGAVEVLAAAEVSRKRDLAFAAREIPPGRLIRAEDLEVRRLHGRDGSVPARSLVGASARTSIPKGAVLAAADLRLAPAVRRGAVVRAIAPAYEADARALSDGAPGDRIEVELLASGRRMPAQVADGGRVEIVEEGSR